MDNTDLSLCIAIVLLPSFFEPHKVALKGPSLWNWLLPHVQGIALNNNESGITTQALNDLLCVIWCAKFRSVDLQILLADDSQAI